MEIEDGSGKRGRGRGRGTRTRARGRGRGRGRGKKVAVVPCSDEETLMEQVFDGASTANLEDCEILPSSNAANEDAVTQKVIEVDHVPPRTNANPTSTRNPTQPQTATNMRTQTIDMEADISQLEAPTFTTISRGPPEPMLRLKWSHKVSLIGEKVLNPMIHICDQCDKPILHYGRMIPCKHVFCLKCARTEPVKTCPRCNDKVVRVEQSGLGTVFMCTHSGSRYGNTGCRRTYLSQRDLQAHINHRHVTQPQHAPTLAGPSNELKMEINSQRKLSEVSAACTALQAPSTHLTQRSSLRPSAIQVGNIAPPGSTSTISSTLSSLTQANLARINNANAADCHQGKVALHQTLKKAPLTQSHHQPPEAVADASYYSSVLNSFGSTTPTNVTPGSTPQNVSSVQAPWQAQSYYR